MIKKYIVLVAFLMIGFLSKAQNVLTVDDAVAIALKNNFDIQVAQNNADIAKINNTIGNAGMLPSVQVNGAISHQNNNVKQQLSNGDTRSIPSAPVTNKSAGVALSWTLFDGGKMFITKQKLNDIQALGELQFKNQVLTTMYQVIAAYYDVVRQKQELSAINEVINYNRERLKIAEAGYNAGSLIKTDVLQAKIDLNVTSESAINQQYNIAAAKKKLNTLLSQDAEKALTVSDSIPLNYTPDEEALKQKLFAANTNVLSYQKQVSIAQLTLKEYKASILPKIDFNAGYNISNSKNSSGYYLTNRAYGPQFGGSIAIPIFEGGNGKRILNTSKIQLKSAEYDLKNVKLQVHTDLLNTLNTFKNQQQLMQIEKENKTLTKENIDISLQRLRLGQSTTLELHMAQDSYVQSCTRLVNFQYNLKLAEIKLKQLMAAL